MHRVKLAIDGCGALTNQTILNHLAYPDAREMAEVVAVCDIDEQRARETADRFGIKTIYTDLDTMLSRCDCDAVLVIVPHALHTPHARKIIAAGRHVYVQKPLGVDLAEVRLLEKEVRASGLKLVSAPCQHRWPLFGRLKAMIAEGAIGRPYFANTFSLGWGGHEVDFPGNPSWFFSDRGGPLRDHGGYSLQILTAIFGRVKRVSAMGAITSPTRAWRGQPFDVTGHDNLAILLDFGDGLLATMHEAWCAPSPDSAVTKMLGLEGSIETLARSASHPGILPFEARLHPWSGKPLEVSVSPDEVDFLRHGHVDGPHVHVWGDIRHLIQSIRENTSTQDSLLHAVHTVEVIDAVFRSIRSGAVQELQA